MEKLTVIERIRNVETDSENEDSAKGLVRGWFNDSEWEKRLSSNIDFLTHAFTATPYTMDPTLMYHIFMNIFVISSVTLGTIVAVFLYIQLFRRTLANLVLSGLCPDVLLEMSYLTLALSVPLPVANVSLLLDTAVFAGVSNPVWRDARHLSTDRTEIMGYIHKMSQVFTSIHSSVEYGAGRGKPSLDSLLDKIKPKRLPSEENGALLLHLSDCLLMDKAKCANRDRIVDQYFPVGGILSLTSSLQLLVSQMYHSSTYMNMDAESAEVQYILSVNRFDLTDGIRQLNLNILHNAQRQIKQSQVVLTVIMMMCVVVVVAVFSVHTVQAHRMIRHKMETTHTLSDLVSADRECVDMKFTAEMRMHDRELDAGREKVMEQAMQMEEMLEEEGSKTEIVKLMESVVSTAARQFGLEEELMEEMGYPKIDEHATTHLLVRQRLTSLVDLFMLSDEATNHICIRMLREIITTHFLEDDVELGSWMAANRVWNDDETKNGDEAGGGEDMWDGD